MSDPSTGSVFSADVLTARAQLIEPSAPLHHWQSGSFDCAVFGNGPSVWLVLTCGETRLALRAALDPRNETLGGYHVDVRPGEVTIDCAATLAAHRIKLRSYTREGMTMVRCTASILPVNGLVLSTQARDLYVIPASNRSADPVGHVYAEQRGLQTGSLFAVSQSPSDFSLLYIQDFGSLAAYFEQTKTTPAHAVGGTWPELGFQLPVNSSEMLLAGNEYVTSDAYITVQRGAPRDDGDAAERYLEGLAATLSVMEAPATTFHFWPAKAAATVSDLSQSPLCRNDVGGHRYPAPYVDDKVKPPESMVTLCVLVALMEYEVWSGKKLALVRDLLRSLPTFYDAEIGSVVRWLPGVPFMKREDEHQTHEAMDSWYLYHVLFNLERLARNDVRIARTLLKKSLPYAIRVARRFAYRWPIFFNLKTLDIIQAEAAKGTGGENDVAGLYALVMFHAYELFGDQEYLDEAKRAADALEGLGFRVTYQTNTTGFAAEAMLRLALLTGEERYRKLSHICLANIFDTMAIWQRSYGYSRSYSTFFALYPLRDAPYVAPYEETEALAKFYEYLRLAGKTAPAPLQALICQYTRHLLSRAWAYYPDSLPPEAIAEKSRNGRVVRELAIPLEDLQDGRVQSGQVGQEIYGAGLALVCTTRHFQRVAGTPLLLFCEFPIFAQTQNRFHIAGDPGSTCWLRLISTDPNVAADPTVLHLKNVRTPSTQRSVEGHAMIEVHGEDEVTIRQARRHPRRRSEDA